VRVSEHLLPFQEESQMKACTVCGQHKELSKDSFYPSVKNRDGYHDVCRPCSLEAFKKKEEKHTVDYFSVEGNIKAARRRKQEEKLIKYMSGLKECKCCGQEKSLGSFYRNTKTKDKLTSWCIDCTKKRYLAVKQDNVVKEQNDNRDSYPYTAKVTWQGQASQV
jgi:hypothetical protein